MIAFKLFRVRKDGSIGSLFIDCKDRLPVGEWLDAKATHRRGYAYRPGWHSTWRPYAPHLSLKGRQWFVVEIEGYCKYPMHNMRALWYLSQRIKILGPCAGVPK